MSKITTHSDAEALTMTMSVEFDAPVEKVWQVWEDPRKLERWWGPPEWPATFDRHDFREGGDVRYHMTGPDGTKSRGWWRLLEVTPHTTIRYEDGFAGDDGEPSGYLGTTTSTVTLTDVGGRTRMVTVTQFESVEQLEEMLKMGMEEGSAAAMGQIEAILADG